MLLSDPIEISNDYNIITNTTTTSNTASTTNNTATNNIKRDKGGIKYIHNNDILNLILLPLNTNNIINKQECLINTTTNNNNNNTMVSNVESTFITITIILVTGNSTNIKYAINEAGSRISEYSFTVSVKDTVASLKDRAGVYFLNYSENWTKVDDPTIKDIVVYNHNQYIIDLSDDNMPMIKPNLR